MLKKNRGNVLKVIGTMIPVGLIAGTLMADGPSFNGFIDTQYKYDFNRPNTNSTALRSYDARHDSIELHNAHVAIFGSLENATYNVEFDMGTDAITTTAGTTGSGASDDFDIQEAYLTYMCPITKLNLKAGKFATPSGIEVIESKDNPTISRGYLFGLALPFTHTGLALSKMFAEKYEVMAGIVNGWDNAADNNNGKTYFSKLGFNFGDPLSLTLSGYHGPEQTNALAATPRVDLDGVNRNMVDLTGVTKIIPKVALWFEVNYGDEERVADNDGDTVNDDSATWGGFAIEPVITLTDKFSIGLRGEYFDDDKGARTGTRDLAAKNFTIAPAWKCTPNVTARAEFRSDSANKKVWVNDKGVAKDSTSTASLQLLMSF
ncbi:MAG: outer membrane beta-barrel protein [Elusimicrobiota bacterium]